MRTVDMVDAFPLSSGPAFLSHYGQVHPHSSISWVPSTVARWGSEKRALYPMPPTPVESNCKETSLTWRVFCGQGLWGWACDLHGVIRVALGLPCVETCILVRV